VVRVALALGLAPLLVPRGLHSAPPEEDLYYRLVPIPIPRGIVLEAGGLEHMADGALAVSTRYGDVYLIDNALEVPPSRMKFQLYASGLHEVLGLARRGEWLYAMQRGELTRMRDLDGD